MIPEPPHNRKLGLLEVSLTKARLRRDWGQALDAVRDELEALLVRSGYLDGAPFSWVTVAIRYGLKNEDAPVYQPINRRYGDLPLAVEIDTHQVLAAASDDLRKLFKRVILKSLIHAGKKYGRPIDRLQAELLETAGGCLPS